MQKMLRNTTKSYSSVTKDRMGFEFNFKKKRFFVIITNKIWVPITILPQDYFDIKAKIRYQMKVSDIKEIRKTFLSPNEFQKIARLVEWRKKITSPKYKEIGAKQRSIILAARREKRKPKTMPREDWRCGKSKIKGNVLISIVS